MSSQTNAEVNRATEVGAIEWNVVEVKAGPGRKLQVRFADGISGMVRFADGFFTGVFEALKDDTLFRRLAAISAPLSRRPEYFNLDFGLG